MATGGQGTDAGLNAVLAGVEGLAYEQDGDLRYRWVHDPSGRADVDAIVGSTDAGLFADPAEGERIERLKRAVMRSREPATTTGSWDWSGISGVCRMVVAPVVAADGRVTGVAGRIRPEPHDQKTLDGSWEQLRRVFEHASSFFSVKAADGRYLVASSRVSDLAETDVIGKSDFDVFPRQVAETSSEFDHAALESNSAIEAEEVWGGATFATIRMPLSVTGIHGPVVCTVAADVTEYTQLLERLLAVQRVELLGGLAGEIAHEFNNLMAVVSTRSQFVIEAVDEEHLRRDLNAIQTAASSGRELTHLLLDFASSRAYGAPGEASRTALRVQALLDRMLPSNIELRTDLDSREAAVDADDAEIELILMNLVINARDAMRAGGTIVITTRVIGGAEGRGHPEARLRSDASYVCLSVADTGVGMAADVAARAVEPFFSTKPYGVGTGLGLATAHEIAKRRGGAVAIESAPRRGTTVRVYLPAATACATGADQRGPAGRQPAVTMVISGDDDQRDDLVRTLTRAGYVALPAATQAEALRLLDAREGEIDLIVTDADTIGASAALERRMSADVPARATTLYLASPGEKGDALEPVLLKPFTPQQLLSAARRALEPRRRGRRGDRRGRRGTD